MREPEYNLLKDKFTSSFGYDKRILEVAIKIISDNILIDDYGFNSMDEIMRAVCAVSGFSKKEVLSKKRKDPLVAARHFFCYLSYTTLNKKTGLSLKDIIQYMGGKNHTVARHGVESFKINLKNKKYIYLSLCNKLDEYLARKNK